MSRRKKRRGESLIGAEMSISTNDLSAERPSQFAKPAKKECAGDFGPPAGADAARRLGRSQTGRLALRTRGKIVFIDPAEISAIEAQGNSALVRAAAGEYLLRQSISDIAERLRPYGFLRIHRSTIVNSALVDELRILNSGEMLLRLKGAEKEYSVSRSYRAGLRTVAALWF